MKCFYLCRIDLENGVLKSPTYPEKYPNNLDCAWPIYAAENTTIRLQFTNFSVSDCIIIRIFIIKEPV